MKILRNKALRIGLISLMGCLGGGVSVWISSGDSARHFQALKESALCILELPQDVTSVTATFELTRPVDTFQVAVKSRGDEEEMSLSISGDKGLIGSCTFRKKGSFGLGRDVRPGTYQATLRRE